MPIAAFALLFVVLLGSGAQAAPLSAATDAAALDGSRSVRGQAVAEVWLIAPTMRYQHFVRGNTAEAGGLRMRRPDGRVLTHLLSEDEAFEDDTPRLADFDGDGIEEIVLVLTSLRQGASLAIFAVGDGGVTLKARTPFIGQPHRWLNPAGIADFDGDGQLEIALVQMPHLAKRLELWRLEPEGLRRVLALDDVANHRAGSVHTGLSAVADFDGDGIDDLVIPDGARRTLRILSFAGGTAREMGRIPLPSPADGDFAVTGQGAELQLAIPLENGETLSLPRVSTSVR